MMDGMASCCSSSYSGVCTAGSQNKVFSEGCLSSASSTKVCGGHHGGGARDGMDPSTEGRVERKKDAHMYLYRTHMTGMKEIGKNTTSLSTRRERGPWREGRRHWNTRRMDVVGVLPFWVVEDERRIRTRIWQSLDFPFVRGLLSRSRSVKFLFLFSLLHTDLSSLSVCMWCMHAVTREGRGNSRCMSMRRRRRHREERERTESDSREERER